MLCDQSAYNLKFQKYTGKSDIVSVEKGQGARVVMDLMDNLAKKNHILYMDNFFSSYNLYKILKDNQIYAVGTVNALQQNLPKLIEDKNLKRDFDWKTSDTGITMFKWKDNKCVHLLSSIHTADDKISVNRKAKNGTLNKVSCPKVLYDYNKNMNFVDNFDCLTQNYGLDRKSKKWYMRMVFHFLGAAITNAFIIHKEIEKCLIFSNKDFRRNIYLDLLAKQIVQTKCLCLTNRIIPSVNKSRKPKVADTIRLESSKHQLERTTMRRCGMCSTKKNRRNLFDDITPVI